VCNRGLNYFWGFSVEMPLHRDWVGKAPIDRHDSGRSRVMPNACQSHQDLTTARTIFNTATVTVGGLYLATNSVTVTVIGTVAAAVVTGWAIWLAHSRKRPTSLAIHRTTGTTTEAPTDF
jgi:hypothetical protein